MADHEEMIGRLIAAAERRAAEEDDLHLPGWDRARWERLLSRAELVGLGAGEVLLKRNAPGQALYFLVEGRLEVSTPRPGAISLGPIATIEPGSVVGEVAFLDRGHRSASVWAVEPAVLFRLSYAEFEALKDADPRLAADLLTAVGQILAARLRKLLAGDTGGMGGPAYG